MAIVNGKSDIYRNVGTTNSRAPDSTRVVGRFYQAIGTVTNLSTDSSGSKYLLCEVPAHALIDPETAFKVDDWGFAAIRIGTANNPDALVSAPRADGPIQSPATKFGANHGTELWERLGLTKPPSGRIAIYAHAIANATAAGSMKFVFRWSGN